MPGALLGATRCGRCGHEAETDGSRPAACRRCGAPWTDAAPASVAEHIAGPLTGTSPATIGRRYAALAIDLFVVGALVVIAIASLLGIVALPAPTWVSVTLAALVLVLQGVAVTTRGRSLGRLLLGLRTVDDLTGTPVRLGRFVRRLGRTGWGRSLVTVDLRRGRDPDRPQTSVPALDLGAATTTPAAEEAARPADGEGRASVGIVLDSGERYEIHRALLLGRNPVDPSGGGDRALLAWPDMSRKLAKTHVLLEWSGTVLWVTDLQTATGTALVGRTGERQPVSPGVRTAAGIGTSIECGGRSLKVVPSG